MSNSKVFFSKKIIYLDPLHDKDLSLALNSNISTHVPTSCQQKQQCWRKQNTLLRSLSQNCSKKHGGRHGTGTESDPRTKEQKWTTQPKLSGFSTKRTKHTLQKRQSFQQTSLGKLDMKKTEIRFLSHTLHKNQWKWSKTGKHFRMEADNDFLNTTSMGQEMITGIEKWRLQQIKQLNPARETIKSEQTDCRLRGKTYQLFIHQGINIQNTLVQKNK